MRPKHTSRTKIVKSQNFQDVPGDHRQRPQPPNRRHHRRLRSTKRGIDLLLPNSQAIDQFFLFVNQLTFQTHVIFPHLVVSNSEDYFEQPERFVPERWLKANSKLKPGCPVSHKKIHPYVSLPFGYGRRSCLGRRFAELELQILLAKVLSNIAGQSAPCV